MDEIYEADLNRTLSTLDIMRKWKPRRSASRDSIVCPSTKQTFLRSIDDIHEEARSTGGQGSEWLEGGAAASPPRIPVRLGEEGQRTSMAIAGIHHSCGDGGALPMHIRT